MHVTRDIWILLGACAWFVVVLAIARLCEADGGLDHENLEEIENG